MISASTHRDIDRAIIAATQDGLPLVSRPFDEVAKRTGLSGQIVKTRLQAMQDGGMIRRIAAVPNHYALGLRANGMTVWDVDDAEIGRLGPMVGALDFVTHCYQRPRVPGVWSYNLFAMVHGESRDEVRNKVDRIKALLGTACAVHDILYSTRILKKTGFRLQG
jgi:DNA-binding Lrp family transcriptional regulator